MFMLASIKRFPATGFECASGSPPAEPDSRGKSTFFTHPGESIKNFINNSLKPFVADEIHAFLYMHAAPLQKTDFTDPIRTTLRYTLIYPLFGILGQLFATGVILSLPVTTIGVLAFSNNPAEGLLGLVAALSIASCFLLYCKTLQIPVAGPLICRLPATFGLDIRFPIESLLSFLKDEPAPIAFNPGADYTTECPSDASDTYREARARVARAILAKDLFGNPSDETEFTRSYRALSILFHPDKHATSSETLKKDANVHMQHINALYTPYSKKCTSPDATD